MLEEFFIKECCACIIAVQFVPAADSAEQTSG